MSTGRVRRLLLSYATAGASKIFAAAVQILALPVVASALGAERFGSLMVMGAMGAAFCMPARAIPPSLSIAIAHSRGSGDSDDLASQTGAAALISIGLGVAALVLLLAVIAVFGLSPFVGASADRTGGDFNGAMEAFVLLIIATYGFAWIEGLRTGYEQHYLNNVFSLVGSVLALLGIALAWAFEPTVTAFFLAIYVVYPMVQLANLLLARRLLPARRQAVSPAAIRAIARRSFSWSVAQAGVVLNLQGTVWLAAHAGGLAAAGVVGAVIRLFQLLNNIFLALLTPLLPTLRHSVTSGDQAWSSRAPRATTMATGVALAVFGIVIALFGNELVRLWLGLKVPLHPIVFVGFGLLAVASMAPQFFYLVLMATGPSKAASLNLLIGGIVGVLLGLAGLRTFGLPGLIWGQALGMLVAACIPNTNLVRRRLSSQVAVVRSQGNSVDGRIST